ncbi:hypothetical protein [Carboxydocella sp. ULO1]|uniref:hypothetical protein n=1 Tax=Carboxydocella sp. ULO1 TaxID=1926599 RepID=UPI0009AC7959|nr:hypothetical protein [Carboxydocella sp. ULO1]GAW28960.1 hypothetical protein ULO1_15300 [Carboxydocella sp. ULO1]
MEASIQELTARIRELERENELLKAQLFSKPSITAHQKIQAAISKRACELEPNASSRFARQALKRRIMEDVKWLLRVRYANQFTEEHVEPALEIIQNWPNWR